LNCEKRERLERKPARSSRIAARYNNVHGDTRRLDSRLLACLLFVAVNLAVMRVSAGLLGDRVS
jgi:hypothetical protein